MNTAEYIVRKLEELGVNEFFGLPGDFNFNILYAIESNPNTCWIGCTNELNAGYAADGYARIRGYGALVTTYGVGELSAINAIAGSMAENVPVVSIVGVPSTKNIEEKTCTHHNFQDVDYYRFFEAYKNVTAASVFLKKDNAKEEIDKVLKILVKEKKPVYIAIPSDVALLEISDKDVSYEWTSDKDSLKNVVNKIVAKINNSKNPVILGDMGVKRFDSRLEYKEFVEKSRIPVTNFLMGTNLIDNDYDLYLGGYYSKYKNPIAEKYVTETDCLIAVGTVYTDLNASGFDLPYKINNQIAIYGTYTYVDGKKYNNVKMSDVLEGITNLVTPKDITIKKPEIGYSVQNSTNQALTSEYIYPKIQEFLKENDIIIAETGIIPHGIAPMKFPKSAEFQTQTLWGSIGWATPAALGISLAKKNSRVILVTGEGSHQLTAMEIGNMMRQNIKPIIIVLNNKGYTIERILSKKPDDCFNEIVQMNYSKLIRAFEGDAWSIKVTTEEDFDKALRITQIMNKLCYIEICTDSLDLPEITKAMAKSLNNYKDVSITDTLEEKQEEIKEQEEAVETNDVTESLPVVEEKTDNEEVKEEEFSQSDYGFNFETTVHKGISEV